MARGNDEEPIRVDKIREDERDIEAVTKGEYKGDDPALKLLNDEVNKSDK